MATLEQLAARKLKTAQPTPPLAPPSGNLSTDPDVLSAYQRAMQYSNQADIDTSSLRRRLADSLLMSKKGRGQSILNNNTRLSDRGLLNSGIALNRNSEIDTQFDTTDRDLTDTTDSNLADIARKKLGFFQDYENTKVTSNAKQTKAAADAQAAALEAQRQADLVRQQQAELLAVLNPVPAAPPTSLPASIYKPPVVNKSSSNASKKDKPKLVLKGGPQ